jgi:hypothetical protein
MNAEQIYRQTLEQLASAGNAEAKLALTLGAPGSAQALDAERVERVCSSIKRANRALGEALSHNDRSWSRATDRAIEAAREDLTQALVTLALK